MSWSFKAWPRPLWFHRESEHPPLRSKLQPPPSMARPSPNKSGGAPSLAEGRSFGRSANSGSRAAIGLEPQPQTSSPLHQQDRQPHHRGLLGTLDSSPTPSLAKWQATVISISISSSDQSKGGPASQLSHTFSAHHISSHQWP